MGLCHIKQTQVFVQFVDQHKAKGNISIYPGESPCSPCSYLYLQHFKRCKSEQSWTSPCFLEPWLRTSARARSCSWSVNPHALGTHTNHNIPPQNAFHLLPALPMPCPPHQPGKAGIRTPFLGHSSSREGQRTSVDQLISSYVGVKVLYGTFTMILGLALAQLEVGIVS